ncbi:MAG: tyrosine-type recombinase/integrase, partial [Candidatus Sumerlaeaceae bacterium]
MRKTDADSKRGGAISRKNDSSTSDALMPRSGGSPSTTDSPSRTRYRHVLGREIGDLGEVVRARKPARLPVVLTRDEVKAVLANLTGDKWLMASMMYGAGLRLMECLRLQVQDIDFARNEILIRDGKGAKDRITMLPSSLKKPLQEHLNKVKTVHERDLVEG